MSVEERAEGVLVEWLREGRRDAVTEGALDMLVTAGVLDEAAADVWRRAILRAADESPPDAEAELRARVERAIDAMEPWMAHGALDLAVALGAVSPHDRVRRHVAKRDEEVPTDPTFEDGAVGWTSYVPIPSDFPEEELVAQFGVDPEEPGPDVLGPLISVAAAPPDRRDGVRLTSIAIHECATVVRWHALVESGDRRPSLELEMTDDRGTDYGPAEPLGASGTDRVRSGATRFRVPVPPAARELRLTWCGGTSRCALSSG